MYKIKPELLSPAGGMESLKAAVQNGCSAVYVGAQEFSARRNAGNFTLQELEEAVDYCHVRGVKLYTAANILVKNFEIDDFLQLMESIYSVGADGVITQDIGCASLIKKYFPDFYLSASTQMTVHDLKGVEFLSRHGFNRIVLSRELSISEITEICDASLADIECFVHGAVCVCYSGQCLMSAFNGGRSGNRGDCAQPCRLPFDMYKESEKISHGSLLSPKDMLGLYALPALIEGGVSSFKIEGRMKSPEYVAGVTAVYRKYIDAYCNNTGSYEVDEKDIEELAAIFNRSGFSRGYFYDHSGKYMMTNGKAGNTGFCIGNTEPCDDRRIRFKTLRALSPGDGIEISGSEAGAYITKPYAAGDMAEIIPRTEIRAEKGTALYRTYDKKLMDKLRASYARDDRKLKIGGRFSAKQGEKMRLCVSSDKIEAEALYGTPEIAQSNPADCESVKKRLEKTGNTPFVFDNLEIALDEGLFISVGNINELRRRALADLEGKLIASYKRIIKRREAHTTVSYIKNKSEINRELTVLVRNAEQLEAVSEYRFSRLYVDFEAENAAIMGFREKGISVYRCLKRIQRENRLDFSNDDKYDGFLIRTYGQAELVKKCNYAVDYTLNIFNNISADFWAGEGCNSVCVSPELDARELQTKAATEVVCYGKIAVMTTSQCPIGNHFGKTKNKKEEPFCKYRNKSGGFSISTGKTYDLLTACDKCYCMVLSAMPINAAKGTFYKYYRIELSNENKVDTKNIMSTYIDHF